jgi:hypothetical protein
LYTEEGPVFVTSIPCCVEVVSPAGAARDVVGALETGGALDTAGALELGASSAGKSDFAPCVAVVTVAPESVVAFTWPVEA